MKFEGGLVVVVTCVSMLPLPLSTLDRLAARGTIDDGRTRSIQEVINLLRCTGRESAELAHCCLLDVTSVLFLHEPVAARGYVF